MNVSGESTRGLFRVLRGFDFLQDISDEHIEELTAIAELVAYPKGVMIFREREPALSCYLIIEGIVALEICTPTAGCATVLTISNGELLSWSPLVGRERLTANARTLTPTTMVELNGEKLLQLCEAVPEFGYKFMQCAARAIAKRLTATRLQLLDLYRHEIPRHPTHSGNPS